MLAVLISFIMFRSDNVSTALKIYKGMLGLNGILMPNILSNFFGLAIDKATYWLQVRATGIDILILISISFFISMLPKSTADLYTNAGNNQLVDRIYGNKYSALILGVVFIFTMLSFSKTSSFLYFQF